MKTEISWDKVKFKSQKMDAWGDFNTYIIAKEDMPESGLAFVMHRKNYSSQPENIRRMDDGSGQLTLFDSRGD